jgi:hypothetical protein
VLDHIDVGEYAAPRNRPVFRKKLNYATTEMLVGPCRVSLIAKSICEEGKSNSRRAAGKFFFPRVRMGRTGVQADVWYRRRRRGPSSDHFVGRNRTVPSKLTSRSFEFQGDPKRGARYAEQRRATSGIEPEHDAYLHSSPP